MGRLYVIHPGESLPSSLTDQGQDVLGFSWSPDGQWIVFETLSTIFVMDASGNNKVQLTPETMISSRPVWSPDSNRIAFNCFPETKKAGICVANRDGTDLRQLTASEDGDNIEGWSPDGSQLVFVSDRNRLPATPSPWFGNYFDVDIWIMNADGTNPHRLTDGQSRHWDPTWSPDGQHIAFVSDKEGIDSIYVIGADSTDELATLHFVAQKYGTSLINNGSELARYRSMIL